MDYERQQFESTRDKVNKVSSLTIRNLNTITGGNSFCYMITMGYSLTDRRPSFIVQGTYPLYDVTARIVDISVPPPTNQGVTPEGYAQRFADYLRQAEVIYPVGNIGGGTTLDLSPNGALPFPMSHQKFNIFFSARNGFWQELYRSVEVGGSTARAIRVTRSSQPHDVMLEKVDKNFPLGPDGKVQW